MSETKYESKTKSKFIILKNRIYKMFMKQIVLTILFIILKIIFKKEIDNLIKFSIENQKKKKKNKSKNMKSYNYNILLVLSSNPITNFLAIDRFYIGNKYAFIKLIINLILFQIDELFFLISYLIDLMLVLNCSMEDKNDKKMCS